MLIVVPLTFIIPNTSAAFSSDTSTDENEIGVYPCEGKYADYGPYDNKAKTGNIFGGTAGKVKKGNFFFLELNETTKQQILINIEIMNKSEVSDSFTSFIETISVYRYEPDNDVESFRDNNSWMEIENKDDLFLTLPSSNIEIEMEYEYIENENALAITVESGSYYAKRGLEEYVPPDFYIELI